LPDAVTAQPTCGYQLMDTSGADPQMPCGVCYPNRLHI